MRHHLFIVEIRIFNIKAISELRPSKTVMRKTRNDWKSKQNEPLWSLSQLFCDCFEKKLSELIQDPFDQTLKSLLVSSTEGNSSLTGEIMRDKRRVIVGSFHLCISKIGSSWELNYNSQGLYLTENKCEDILFFSEIESWFRYFQNKQHVRLVKHSKISIFIRSARIESKFISISNRNRTNISNSLPESIK